MKTEPRCTCGNTNVSYHHDENQHEPDCWDCYHQAQDKYYLEDSLRVHGITPMLEDDLPF